MKTGVGDLGFTIVETIIFLAVSSGLFIIAANTIGGQQAKTQFTQSVNNFESRLQDLANDVSTGYYVNPNNFSCSVAPAGPPIITASASNDQGANSGCIFVGQVLEFPKDSPSFTLYPLAGRQTVGSAQVVDLDSAKPIAINPFATTTEKIGYGTVIGKVTYDNGSGVSSNIAGIALTTTFGSYSSGNLNSGDIRTDVIALNLADPSVVNGLTWASQIKNPTNGLTICLQDSPGSGASRYAQVILGGNGRQYSTQVKFGSGACP